MRVVHVNCYFHPNSADVRLHNALLDMGIDSMVVGLRHTGKIRNAWDLEYNLDVKNRVIQNLNKISEKICMFQFHKQKNILKNYPWSNGMKGIDIHTLEIIRTADIIHLNWICNIVSIREIQKILKLGIPVVWTCHDQWPMTGGCHCSDNCTKWKSGCGNCHLLQSENEKDKSRYIFTLKKKCFKAENLFMVGCSNWMTENLRESKLFATKKCYYVPNTLPIDVYKIYDKKIVSNKLKYKNDKKINILFGATSLAIPYKGFYYLAEIIQMFKHESPDLLKNMVIHLVGECNVDESVLKDVSYKTWGFIDSQEKMAYIYNLADVLLYPSIQDNLPGMVMEALACATPVVAFNVGGIVDMIEHMINGYIAEYMNSEDLFKGLLWIIKNNDKNVLGMNGRKTIVKKFSPEIVASKYCNVYTEITGRQKNKF